MIRKAKLDDLDDIFNIINDAKEFMNETDNVQWDESYPSYSLLKDEIDDIYVYEIDNKVVGTISIKNYIEPNYNYIEGSFLTNDIDYLTLHRLAVKKDYHGLGIAKQLINHSFILAKEKNIKSVKADTYITNKIMNNIFIKLGFKFCGYIFIDNRKFNAYERLVD